MKEASTRWAYILGLLLAASGMFSLAFQFYFERADALHKLSSWRVIEGTVERCDRMSKAVKSMYQTYLVFKQENGDTVRGMLTDTLEHDRGDTLSVYADPAEFPLKNGASFKHLTTQDQLESHSDGTQMRLLVICTLTGILALVFCPIVFIKLGRPEKNPFGVMTFLPANKSPYPGASSPALLSPTAGLPATIVDHRGETGATRDDFICGPPREIGRLISAESTMRNGRGAKPLVVRMLPELVSAAGIIFLFHLIASESAKSVKGNLPLGVGIFGYCFGILFLVRSWFSNREVVRCTFVGENGLAISTAKDSQKSKPLVKLLAFDSAMELYSGLTRSFVNGIYMGIFFNYQWISAADAIAFDCKGRVYRRKQPRGHLWNFGFAAEVAWTAHFMERARHRLAVGGSVPFRVGDDKLLLVSSKGIEIHYANRIVRLEKEDIKAFRIDQGWCSINYHTADRIRFKYSQIANARVFIQVLDEALHFRIPDLNRAFAFQFTR